MNRHVEKERRGQLEFYSERVDTEEEITRPRCYPRHVRDLLEFKVRSTCQLAEAMAEQPAGNETVLVVCCGSGMEAEMLARAGKRVIGLDLSPDAVRRARERAARFGVRYELLVGDATNLPFPANSVDWVFVHDGLHHLPDPYDGVRQMLRVARKAVLIAEPNDGTLTRFAIWLGVASYCEDAGNYVYRLRPERLGQVFYEHGIETWRFERSWVYYHPWTFRIYRLLERQPLFWLMRAGLAVVDFLFGRWGNSLRVAAVKPPSTNAQPRAADVDSQPAPAKEASRCISWS